MLLFSNESLKIRSGILTEKFLCVYLGSFHHCNLHIVCQVPGQSSPFHQGLEGDWCMIDGDSDAHLHTFWNTETKSPTLKTLRHLRWKIKDDEVFAIFFLAGDIYYLKIHKKYFSLHIWRYTVSTKESLCGKWSLCGNGFYGEHIKFWQFNR